MQSFLDVLRAQIPSVLQTEVFCEGGNDLVGRLSQISKPNRKDLKTTIIIARKRQNPVNIKAILKKPSIFF